MEKCPARRHKRQLGCLSTVARVIEEAEHDKEVGSDFRMQRDRLHNIVQRTGVSRFFAAGTRGGARCHAGSWLLWARLSPQRVRLLRSQWYTLLRPARRSCPARRSRPAGCRANVSIWLPFWSVRPLHPLVS